MYRSYALWELGIRWFQNARIDRAEEFLQEGLRFAHMINDQRNVAGCLEGLAWVAAQRDNPKGAAVMMGAADALARAIGCRAIPLPRLDVFHAECESRSREALGDDEFEASRQQGSTMSSDEALAYALADHA